VIAAAANARIAAERQIDLEMAAFDSEPLPVLEMTKPKLGEDRFEYSNPLQWWSEKDKKFPLHAKIARRYLCIPATSAPSERVFCAAGLTIAQERASLNPAARRDTAGALTFSHDAWDIVENFLKAR
jgi:hypothetical protein